MKIGKGGLLVGFVLFVILDASIYFMVAGWKLAAGVEMSGQAIFAMVLGIVFSLAVGFGLMFLVFYSSRHGFDEAPHRVQKDE